MAAVAGEGKLLESWKEISAYLKRSERTCRRWEETLDLPIHRLDGTPNARVFAYTDEFDRWLTEKLHHLEAEEPASTRPPFVGKNKRPLFVAAAVIAIMALAGAFLFVQPLLLPRPAPGPGANPILVIFPFENPSGDKVLESWRFALPDLLITDLYQSRYLDVVPVWEMRTRFKDMKLSGALRLSADDRAAFVKRYEQDFTGTGRLDKAGNGITVEIVLRSEKATKEPPHVLRMVARNERELIGKADVLSREIKNALGLTRRQITADIDAPLRRIATASPEAMKFYAQAVWLGESGPYPDKGPAIEKALAIDPEFGLAHNRMFFAYQNSRVEDAVRSYEKALSFAGRMSEREFLLLQADFYDFWCTGGYKELPAAGIPAMTIERLKPKTRTEVLPVLERLAALYPDFQGCRMEFQDLVDIYCETEEWDKAIAVLEIVAPLTLKSIPINTQSLIDCYLARGWIDRAEAATASLESLEKGTAFGVGPNHRRDIALKKRMYDEALAQVEKTIIGSRPGPRPYAFYSERGYILWLADDLSGAEKAYRTAIPGANLDVELQRAMDLAVLSLSQGKIGLALAEASKGLEIAQKDKDFGGFDTPGKFHHILAYLYRLAGRLPEALTEAEAACRGYDSPDIPPGLAVKLLHLRALLSLESGKTDEFSRLLEKIRVFCAQEGTPKFLRAYHHLRGLQELRQGRSQKAISELQLAMELSSPPTSRSDPSSVLFSLAEVYESMGERMRAAACLDDIAALPDRESFAGDVYALSFYRGAKLYEDRSKQGLRGGDSKFRDRAIAGYRKFLSLWGNADPPFTGQVEDARRRLAALEAQEESSRKPRT
jgi:tetratricopeptide (TPR) repeat protein